MSVLFSVSATSTNPRVWFRFFPLSHTRSLPGTFRGATLTHGVQLVVLPWLLLTLGRGLEVFLRLERRIGEIQTGRS